MKQKTINSLHLLIVAVLMLLAFGLMAFAVTSHSILEAIVYASLGVGIGLISVGLYQKFQIERSLPEDILEK